jgi:heavy metal translocating P-type ATPase
MIQSSKIIKEFSLFYQQAKWQTLLTILSLLAIIFHFALSSNQPLFLAIILGTIPLLAQITIKIFKRNFGADILAAIGLVLAIYLGEYLAATLVILMLASGQALEEYASVRASFALEALADRIPNIAHLKLGNDISDIEISAIKLGDLLEVFPHETAPVDGVVISGKSTMDESYLTGEPYHISKTIGSKVISGAINGDSSLIISCEKLPQNSRYAEIVKVMQEAAQKRPHLRKLADQIGAIFAPFALIFALATLFLTDSLTNFLSVLVVATPCPLLIAIPITIISAISIAARSGIIIRDPVILEKIPTCKTAIFDKTGTLTYGEPTISNIVTFNDFEKSKILQLTASLERYSRHPLSSAILNAAKKENLDLLVVQNISEKAGAGLIGKVENYEISITNRKHFENSQNLELPTLINGLECLILINQKLAAIFHFHDAARADSQPFVNHLAPHHNFEKIILLSGDRESEVAYLAGHLGIKEFYAAQTPEEKLTIVERESKLAPTIFMGDGINDAPALMIATAGIAFGKNNSITSLSAGAVILENSLKKVDELIHISEMTRKIALQSAIGGMGLSVVGMFLAAGGIINPASAALLQEVIDIVAILNALRLTFSKSVSSDIGAA